VDSLYLSRSDLLARQLLIAYARSSAIIKATSFSTLFSILSSPRAFLFRSLQITLSNCCLVTLLLIMTTCSICVSFVVLLRFACPVFGKNFSDKIWTL
jgi:hypothetical protein